ncbi:unnamed protein product, partial [Staurois parvus]
GTSGHRQSGTGGGTAGHRWGHCWAQVGGASGRTAGRNLRVSLLGTDHQGTDHQCPDDRVRKVQPRTGTCISL